MQAIDYATLPDVSVELLKQLSKNGELCQPFAGISNEIYHRGPGISCSSLQNILKTTPAHWKEQLKHPKQKEAYSFGTAFHSLILEPEEFAKNYIRLPDRMKNVAKRSALDKAKWAEFSMELMESGKLVIDDDDWESLHKMRDKLYSKKKISWLLKNGVSELSCYWIDEESGELCKCRPDRIMNNQPVVVDLKMVGHKAKGTFKSANKAKFKNALGDYGYYMQAAMYLDGASAAIGRKFTAFVFIVCEAMPPYGVAAYVLSPRNSAMTLAQGRHDYKEALWQYAWCKQEDMWPDYPDEIQPIDLPNWRITVNQDE